MRKLALFAGLLVAYALPDGPYKGEVRGAIVTRVWNDTCVNLQVFTDGSNDGDQYSTAKGPTWKTSVVMGGPGTPGTWFHPEDQALPLAEAEPAAPPAEAAPAEAIAPSPPAPRTPIASSNLVSVGYNADSSELDVEFKGGAVYRYSNVPASVHAELVAADSAGSYLALNIKDGYKVEKLDPAIAPPSV